MGAPASRPTPPLIVWMSFRLAIPWRVALQQGLPPLRQPFTFCTQRFRRTMSFHRTAYCGLTGCLSRGVHSTNAGYLLNCIKGTGVSRGPYKLHRADCVRFKVKGRFGRNFTTGEYYKVCSTNKRELTSWSRCLFRRETIECKLCFRNEVGGIDG
jgi:hypothetical protein